jgi:O-antigen/teichoic acid export membrane protein
VTGTASGRFDLRGRTLRQHAARGTLVNAAFMVGLGVLSLLRGVAVAAFVSASDYGLWGVLAVSLGTLLWFKQVGVGDKYVQQDGEDQEDAYHRAFTVELILTLAVTVLLAALVPLLVTVYGQPDLAAPGLVMVAAVPLIAFQSTVWVYYRRMDFLRQRLLQAVDPVVGFVVTLGLAIAGAGYWSFVWGFVAGMAASAVVALIAAPIRPRLRYDKGTLRSYASFSWPLFLAGVGTLVIAQVAIFGTQAHLGLAATGALTLSTTITQFTTSVDQLVTNTLYPAICSVRDRTDVLLESFTKSNRLALMWGVPFGLAVALFAGDLVHFVIGDKWDNAIRLLQISGVVAAMGQVGFNWDAYFRARNDTRPMAVASLGAAGAFVVTGIPLLLTDGLEGLAIAIAVQAVVHLVFRAWYLQRLFAGLSFVRHALRGVLPTLPGVAVVALARAVEGGDRTLALALGELALFILVTAVVTWTVERPLLREALGYVTGRPVAGAVA